MSLSGYIGTSKNAETIKYMAFHDQLTGLLNRRALLDDLDTAIKKYRNGSKEFALFSIDLDRFKYLNDTLGHLYGDEILKKVAERLSGLQKTIAEYIVKEETSLSFCFLIQQGKRQTVSLKNC